MIQRLFVASLILTATAFAGASRCEVGKGRPGCSPVTPPAKQDTAEAQLFTAMAKAKQENKLVFLRFSEVWCGHCTRMQQILDRPNMKAIFGAEFVDLKIDLTKTPKARALYLKYAKNGDGVPWFAMVDTQGVPLASSVGPKGNIGCPELPEEIAFFVDGLRRTTRMTASQLDEVAAAFKRR